MWHSGGSRICQGADHAESRPHGRPMRGLPPDGELFVHFHTKRGQKLRENGSSPELSYEADCMLSRSYDQPLLLLNGGRPPCPPMPRSASERTSNLKNSLSFLSAKLHPRIGIARTYNGVSKTRCYATGYYYQDFRLCLFFQLQQIKLGPQK